MAKKGDGPDVLRLVVVFLRFFGNRTQAELADACGVYQADVSRYESGLQAPSERTLRRMAAAVGVPWTVVAHLRRFYGAVLDAVRHESGAQSGEERLERTILEPALLAVAAYRVEDDAATEELARRVTAEIAEIEALRRWPSRSEP